MTRTAETIPFQAETRELLDLVIHSLYTNKEIFLRELISNASDALDKLRFEALTRAELEVDPDRLEIRLAVDTEARTLSISDNGIGMTREEVVENIGTIARSGTKGFLQALRQSREAGAQDLPEMIGQFGVGFYSSFMVADEVTLETRARGMDRGVRWTSRGQGEYNLEEIEREEFGTTVTLHLLPLEEENGQDFTQDWVVREVVKRYSDFVSYPIRLETGADEEAKWETLNSQKPIWTRDRSEVEESEYAEFYKHLARDWNDPLETIHFRVEGTTEYTALLFVPSERPLDLFESNDQKARVHLYVKRVFIMADCEELLPPWLRFVRGIVDCADLPLNVSRETLQHARQLEPIQKRLTRKVVESLKAMLDQRREDYERFWKAFGQVFKEGIYYDDDQREALAKLLIAPSTAGEELTTLTDYVERMPVKQKAIYVLMAPDLDRARSSPHLEAFLARGFEVLLLTDPVDEFLLQRLTEFEGRSIVPIDRDDLDLGEEAEKEARQEKEKELTPLLESVRKELAEQVSEARFSNRLTESPACLVSAKDALSPQMERYLRDRGQAVPSTKRVLELNAEHPLIQHLGSLAEDDQGHARFTEYCELLYAQALMAEGSNPDDPARVSQLIARLMLGESGSPSSAASAADTD